MFVGRKRELKALNDVYEKNGFGMTIIYGRRRIGKSTLIKEFIKGKKVIFYTATKVGAERNLELFSKQVLDVLDPAMSAATFSSIESVLDIITDKVQADEKTILVIDELPYWAEKDDALLSVLQKHIDTQWIDKNIMLILCGSALSFMENKVLSEKSPIFGRRDSQIKLEAFNYRDSALFVPDYSAEEKRSVTELPEELPNTCHYLTTKKVLMKTLYDCSLIPMVICLTKLKIFLSKNFQMLLL